MPPTLPFGELTSDTIEALVALRTQPEQPEFWDELARGELLPQDQAFLAAVVARLEHFPAHRANEATTWARAIYPLLTLAEQGNIRAFAEVPMSAKIGDTELSGIADGALALGISADARAPFVVVIEAKRGVRATDPLPQLLGALLCASSLNQRAGQAVPSFGVFTIADIWTFARAMCTPAIEGGKVQMTVTLSREYAERTEATAIVRILQSLVAQALAPVEAERGAT